MEHWEEIRAAICGAGHPDPGDPDPVQVGGGCINECWRVGSGHRYFLKRNVAARLDLFLAESEGLVELAAAKALRVPSPICTGLAGDGSFLVMEYLELGGGRSGREMGRLLAQQHRKLSPNRQFGWHRDNAIGETPQENPWIESWGAFFRDHRLAPMVGRAREKGLELPGADELLSNIGRFLEGHKPMPSLLHGDLWSGNAGTTMAGEPAVFDPACYFGDRETDLAFTELFGGFSPSFYQGYRETWAPDAGYGVRRDLYNLYHIINHFVLFGGSYGGQAERVIAGLLR